MMFVKNGDGNKRFIPLVKDANSTIGYRLAKVVSGDITIYGAGTSRPIDVNEHWFQPSGDVFSAYKYGDDFQVAVKTNSNGEISSVSDIDGSGLCVYGHNSSGARPYKVDSGKIALFISFPYGVMWGPRWHINPHYISGTKRWIDLVEGASGPFLFSQGAFGVYHDTTMGGFSGFKFKYPTSSDYNPYVGLGIDMIALVACSKNYVVPTGMGNCLFSSGDLSKSSPEFYEDYDESYPNSWMSRNWVAPEGDLPYYVKPSFEKTKLGTRTIDGTEMDIYLCVCNPIVPVAFGLMGKNAIRVLPNEVGFFSLPAIEFGLGRTNVNLKFRILDFFVGYRESTWATWPC